MARLFHVPLSPFCRKVRLSLAEKKIEVELVEERYWEQEPDFLRRNPAGKVPILKIDGRVLAESTDADASAWLFSLFIVISLMHFWYDGFVWSVRRKQV